MYSILETGLAELRERLNTVWGMEVQEREELVMSVGVIQ